MPRVFTIILRIMMVVIMWIGFLIQCAQSCQYNSIQIVNEKQWVQYNSFAQVGIHIINRITIQYKQQRYPDMTQSQPKSRAELLKQSILTEFQKSQSQILEDQAFISQLQSMKQQAQQQEQAYDNMISQWKMRQHQSYNRTTGQTIYTYDPNYINFSVYQKPVSEERNQIFSKYSAEICKYLSAKYIVEEIIQMIKEANIINQDKLIDVQMMYLLTFRAWSQINTVLRSFHAIKSAPKPLPIPSQSPLRPSNNRLTISTCDRVQLTFSNYDTSLKYLLQPMIKLCIKIDKMFIYYHKLLTSKEAYFKNKISAFFYFVFHHADKVKQDRFLCGFQGMDFQRQEQIQYMCQKYIVPFVDNIRKQKCGNQVLSIKLAVLKDVLMINIQNMEGFDSFDVIKTQLITKERQRLHQEGKK